MPIRMDRAWAMPSGDTFSIKPIGALLDRVLPVGGVIVDPFARNSKRGTITNDLNPATEAMHHMDATAFVEKLAQDGVVADAILFDPPYSLRQAKEIYESVGRDFTLHDSQDVGRWTMLRAGLAALLRPEGICVSCGWNTQGLGKKNGVEIVEILLVCHGGAHNDTIVTVERKHA